MKNRIITAAIGLSMIISLAACGNSSQNSQNSGSTSSISRTVATQSASTQSASAQSASSADSSADSTGSSSEEITSDSTSVVLEGGWEITQGSPAPADNPDAREAFDKALEGLTGCDYDLIAVLGSQVVAGTNYSYLCRETIVVPDAEPDFAVLNVYEDLNGNAEITGDKPLPLPDASDNSSVSEDGSDTESSSSMSTSGSSADEADASVNADAESDSSADSTTALKWNINPDDANLDAHEEAKDAFEKATAGDSSASYDPVAYIGSRKNGSNTEYAVFCSTSEGGSTKGFCVVTVSADTSGSASVVSTADVDPYTS